MADPTIPDPNGDDQPARKARGDGGSNEPTGEFELGQPNSPDIKDTPGYALLALLVDDPDTPEEIAIIETATDALWRVLKTFEDGWLPIAAAINLGRQRALYETAAEDTEDRAYRKAMSRWLDLHPQFGNDRIKKATRSWLLRCWDHRDAIVMWRALKPDAAIEQLNYNYPETVFKRWARVERPELLTEAQRHSKPTVERATRSLIQAANAAAERVVESVDHLEESVPLRHYDLSTAELAFESASNFVQFYEPVHRWQGIRWFGMALIALADQAEHPRVPEPPDPAFEQSLTKVKTRRRSRKPKPEEA